MILFLSDLTMASNAYFLSFARKKKIKCLKYRDFNKQMSADARIKWSIEISEMMKIKQ